LEVGLIVDGEVLHLTPTQLAALLRHEQLEAVADRRAWRGVGAGGRQHQANLDLGLRLGMNGTAGGGEGKSEGCLAEELLSGFHENVSSSLCTMVCLFGCGAESRRLGVAGTQPSATS
jgi:hypothetical protein